MPQETLAGSIGYDLALKEGKGKKGINLSINEDMVQKAKVHSAIRHKDTEWVFHQ